MRVVSVFAGELCTIDVILSHVATFQRKMAKYVSAETTKSHEQSFGSWSTSAAKTVRLFATLAGGKTFSTLHLSQAYQQLLLDDGSGEYVTINMHRGLYRYTRLPFGIASTPALFQKVMDTILQDIPNIICYIGDIFITRSDKHIYETSQHDYRNMEYEWKKRNTIYVPICPISRTSHWCRWASCNYWETGSCCEGTRACKC